MMDKRTEYVLDKYEEMELLAETPKSKVYIVKDSVSKRLCVKKVLPLDANVEIYRILQTHAIKNVPKVYDVLADDQHNYIIEEYISGSNLMDKLKAEKSFSSEHVIKWLKMLCEITSDLHDLETPIIHRDIKPSNVIITDDGELKLIDFDIARKYKEHVETDTAQIGTKKYASPEQYGFSQTDCRSDIYSIGVMMAELLTGKASAKPEELQKFGALGTIIQKCMQVDPKNRYQTISALKRDIRFIRFLPFKKAAIAAAAVLGVALVGVLVYIISVNMSIPKISLGSAVVSADGAEIVFDITIDGDNSFMRSGANRLPLPELSGALAEKMDSFQADIVDDKVFQFILYVADPYNAFAVGDKLEIDFPPGTFLKKATNQQVTVTIAAIAEAPAFIITPTVVTMNKSEITLDLKITGDSGFVKTDDYSKLYFIYGKVLSRTHDPAITVSDDGKTMRMVFAARGYAERYFINNEDLSIVFLPGCFTNEPLRKKEVPCIVTNGIE